MSELELDSLEGLNVTFPTDDQELVLKLHENYADFVSNIDSILQMALNVNSLSELAHKLEKGLFASYSIDDVDVSSRMIGVQMSALSILSSKASIMEHKAKDVMQREELKARYQVRQKDPKLPDLPDKLTESGISEYLATYESLFPEFVEARKQYYVAQVFSRTLSGLMGGLSAKSYNLRNFSYMNNSSNSFN